MINKSALLSRVGPKIHQNFIQSFIKASERKEPLPLRRGPGVLNIFQSLKNNLDDKSNIFPVPSLKNFLSYLLERGF